MDEYHRAFPKDVRAFLEELHNMIKAVIPDANETISYNMPAFRKNRNLVYYTAHKEHIGFYPSSAPLTVFAKELAKFKTSKGAIQFPFGKPLPKTLIKRIVKYQAQQDAEKLTQKD